MSVSTAVPARAQTPLPGDPRLIRVYRATDWKEMGSCAGATLDGHCAHPREDGTVPCAGCVIVLPMAVEGSVQWHIPDGYRTCFAAGFAEYCRAGG